MNSTQHSATPYLQILRDAGYVADFIARLPDLQLSYDRQTIMQDCLLPHQRILQQRYPQQWLQARAEQVHGNLVSRVEPLAPEQLYPAADGLYSGDCGVMLGIYVADCAAVWLADRHGRGMALLHSGKQGTLQNISGVAVQKLAKLGIAASDLLAVISPCIRPPHYEIDIATLIAAQLREAGVRKEHLHDSGLCTASDTNSFFSYRMESGCTSRMLAVLAKPC